MRNKIVCFLSFAVLFVFGANRGAAETTTSSLGASMIVAASTAPKETVELSTTAVLAQAMAYDQKIERAMLRFDEEFVIVSTGEKERLAGKVYFDRPSSRARVDYSGRVKYRLWLDTQKIHFYDLALKQVVIRSWEDFAQAHFQAFLDLPILLSMDRFQERYDWSLNPQQSSMVVNEVFLKAVPKKRAVPYELVFSFDRQSGMLKGLEMVVEGYRAIVRITDFQPSAKFNDHVFAMDFPDDVNVLDLTKGP